MYSADRHTCRHLYSAPTLEHRDISATHHARDTNLSYTVALYAFFETNMSRLPFTDHFLGDCHVSAHRHLPASAAAISAHCRDHLNPV